MSSTSRHFLVYVRSGNCAEALWAYDNRKAAEAHRDFILRQLEGFSVGVLRQFIQGCFVQESSKVVRSEFNPNGQESNPC
jgi:hypothetical protein